jgi:hypothetical protein
VCREKGEETEREIGKERELESDREIKKEREERNLRVSTLKAIHNLCAMFDFG